MKEVYDGESLKGVKRRRRSRGMVRGEMEAGTALWEQRGGSFQGGSSESSNIDPAKKTPHNPRLQNV